MISRRKVQPDKVVFVKEVEEDSSGAFKFNSYTSKLVTYPFDIKAGLNNFRIFPERAENAFYPDNGGFVAVGGGYPTELIQPFVARGDSVTSVDIVAEGVRTPVVVDDFEGYASEAELDASWVQNDPANTTATLMTGGVFGGKWMQVNTTTNRSAGDYVRHTFSPSQDWSSYEGIEMRMLCSRSDYMQLRITDENGSAAYVSLPQVGNVTLMRFPFSSFVKVGANFPDLLRIQSVEFYCAVDAQPTVLSVDDIHVYPAAVTNGLIGLVRIISLSPLVFEDLLLDTGGMSKNFRVMNWPKSVYRIEIPRGVLNSENRLSSGSLYGLRFHSLDRELRFYTANGSMRCYTLSGGVWQEQERGLCFIQSGFPRCRKRVTSFALSRSGGTSPESYWYLYITDEEGRILRAVSEHESQFAMGYYGVDIGLEPNESLLFVVQKSETAAFTRVDLFLRIDFEEL